MSREVCNGIPGYVLLIGWTPPKDLNQNLATISIWNLVVHIFGLCEKVWYQMSL